jgi:formylglycine-generating enzyme required for sulfatase activity
MKILIFLTVVFTFFNVSFAQKDQGPEMILIEGGEYYMGNDYSANNDERPEHKVMLNSFFMSKNEVTVEEYAKFTRVTGHKAPDGEANAPINNITWEEAVMYCNWLSRASGYDKCYDLKRDSSRFKVTFIPGSNGYRLPSEAEWEYASRGGIKSKSYAYSGSHELDEVAWYISNAGNAPHEVGQKKPNELGLYDMTGNAMEWCYDWYIIDYYKNSPTENPTGPETSISKVCRGGNYMCQPDVLRITRRFNLEPNAQEGLAGIRLVRNQ